MSFGMEAYEADPGWEFLRLTGDRALKVPDFLQNYDSKKSCWIADPEEGFVSAEITGAKGDLNVVRSSKGTEVTLKKELCQEMNPAKYERTEDMSNLTFLNDASVLHNLRARYKEMMIYTYSGLFCVVINPYKRLPIYTESVVKMFMGKRRNEMPPHLFAVSDEAYRNMLQDRANQSMLITGESGAGKTENTKKVISYFAVVGATQQAAAKAEAGDKKKATLEEQIVQTNPVLESFGNAKTVRNNNSSRFGKFIRVHFDRSGKMAGGDIDHYLLEKSRAIKQSPGERCFHIFYQLHSGYFSDMKKKLLLDQDVRYYHFVSQGEITIDGVDDKEEMRLTDEAFNILGFTAQEKEEMYKLCSALMHMGEMKFKQRGEQAEPEDDIEEAKKASEMFGVSHEEFLKALTKPRVRVGTEWVNKGQTVDQVTWAIGAISKSIFARKFKWLVSRCNKTLDACQAERNYWIGVLDIAGFEIFDFNSFEQQWINFVNEKLQQFFNHHMFVLEQEEYQREGIKWEFIDFGLDLQATIELIEKPLGIISMLDEECIVPKATDLTYAEKLCTQHLGKHPNFEKPKPPKGKQSEAHFAVRHYAGTVRYNVIGWLEKNKDPLNDSLVTVLKATKQNTLLNAIWQDYTTQEEAAKDTGGGGKHKGKSGSFLTVSMVYRESLNNLMNMLQKTHPHFIRCIIPNEIKTSGVLDAALVLNQLTCNGVLEGIRICRKGFPNRMVHKDFKQRYALLCSEVAKKHEEPKAAAEAILMELQNRKELTEEHYRIGHTKNNIRAWLTLRYWNWYLLFGKLRPNLKAGKEDEEMQKLKERIKQLEAEYAAEEERRKGLEEEQKKLLEEKNALFLELEKLRDSGHGIEEKVAKLLAQKSDLEKRSEELKTRIADQEDRAAEIQRAKKRVETEMETTKKRIQDLELALQKAQAETRAKEDQIASLQLEMASQDEVVARLNKEKKMQEETNRKLGDELLTTLDKMNYLNKLKAKLEQQLDEIEVSLERERRIRQEIEKLQRKVEGDLRVAQEKLEEATKRRQDTENNLRIKEQEVGTMNTRLDDERNLVAKLHKQLKEMQAKTDEIHEELQLERQSRSKAEKAKSDAQKQLDDMTQRLEEAGGMTAAQLEINKRREAELARLRRELDETMRSHEEQLSVLKTKHNDSIVGIGEHIDQLQKSKAKTEKEKTSVQREVDDLRASIDGENKAKQNSEKLTKQLEVQLADIVSKHDENFRQIQEFNLLKSRLSGENAEIIRQLEAVESQVNAITRTNQQLTSQFNDSKRTFEDETKDKQAVAAQLRNMEHENNSLREQIEEQVQARAELLRQLSNVNAEIQQWRAKFESEGMIKAEELEEAKKLLSKLADMSEQLEQANVKIGALDKTRLRLTTELEDAQVDVEKITNYVAALEKQQKGFDRITEEWKRKHDDLKAELDASQREGRNLSTESFKLKGEMDELAEQHEVSLRENKNLAQEVKDLTDQLTDGGKSAHELQKTSQRLELEKEELQSALEEAEVALEAEQSKVIRAQIEISHIRQEIEKRIQEKEEEFENTRKNHQRALETIQMSIESEVKGRVELTRVKKKLEADITDLEVALDHANKANIDAQRTVKRYQEYVQELTTHLDAEQKDRENIRQQFHGSEQRCAQLHAEKLDLANNLESVDRIRKQVEKDVTEAKEQLMDVQAQNLALVPSKKQLEIELSGLHVDLDDSLNQLRTSEEMSAKAQMDCQKLSEELRQEQEHSQQIEQMRKSLESQVRDIQLRIDEAEAAALKGGKRIISKLETRVRDLEHELDGEQRRHAELQKNFAKSENQLRSVQFQQEEGRKDVENSEELIEKLQTKLKSMKRQMEDAEEVAATNLAKYRQTQQQVDDAQQRADLAENSLAKLRAKVRGTSDQPELAHSISLGNVLRTSTSYF